MFRMHYVRTMYRTYFAILPRVGIGKDVQSIASLCAPGVAQVLDSVAGDPHEVIL